jgi:ABC-type nitrate/sulfonate/bicarbonate transport systems, periplasmic components
MIHSSNGSNGSVIATKTEVISLSARFVRPFHNRGAVFVSVLAILPLLLVSCGSSQSSAPGPNGIEKNKLTVAALPIVDDAPLFLAKERGLFAAEGLDVKIQILQQSSLAIPGLINGSIDVVGGGNYVTFLQANDSGALKVRILHAAYEARPGVDVVLVEPSSPIRRPQDLAGKKIAVNILNNVQSLTLDAVLAADGVDPSTIHYVQIPFPNMAAAMQRGQVDAAYTVEPFSTDAIHTLGARTVADATSGPTANFPLSGYFATDRFVTKNPNTAHAFQRALAKAAAMAADRPTLDGILASYTKITPSDASKLAVGAFPVTTEADALQRVADLMSQHGMLKGSSKVDSLVFR